MTKFSTLCVRAALAAGVALALAGPAQAERGLVPLAHFASVSFSPGLGILDWLRWLLGAL
jgi:hypothetical protein